MRLLVCYDGSETAAEILPAVSRTLGTVPDAEVHLLRVLSPDAARGRAAAQVSQPPLRLTAGQRAREATFPRVVEDHGAALERIRHAALEELHEFALQLPAGTQAVLHVEYSDHPAETIVRLATELGVRAIAMATHGRSRVGRAVAGSVTSQVLRRATVPVLVVGPALDAGLAGRGESHVVTRGAT